MSIPLAVPWPPDLDIKRNVSLAPHSSWLVGGPADFFCEPNTVEILTDVVRFAAKLQTPVFFLGGGTNVLISDLGVRGLVISLAKLSGISQIKADDKLTFWALAGTPKSEMLKIFLKYKLPCAKFLAGLPGQVGGGVVMNAGVSEQLSPKEFRGIVEEIEVLRPEGQRQIIGPKQLTWGYRHCQGWQPGVIVRVLISVPNTPDPAALSEVRQLNQSRLKKQPLEWPSCGSVFRNPLPQTAGKLIEDAGLKGRQIGGAQISEKHGNFIINRGGATAKDVRSLMDLCVRCVSDKFGVELKSEVVWLGEP